MRWWSFKRTAVCLTLVAAGAASAEGLPGQDTLRADTLPGRETPFLYRYDRRLERYRRRFNSLIPQTYLLQCYGDMGLVSVGVGWDYGRREQWETDVLLGIVPKYQSKSTKVSLTLKQTFVPWSFSVSELFSIEPLSTGLYLNTVFGNQFWTSEPDRYPKGYYGFSTRMRIHVFVGQGVTLAVPPRKRFFAKAVTAFYEVSTCDLYLVSAFTNSSLTPKDYLRLSFGLRFKIL